MCRTSEIGQTSDNFATSLQGKETKCMIICRTSEMLRTSEVSDVRHRTDVRGFCKVSGHAGRTLQQCMSDVRSKSDVRNFQMSDVRSTSDVRWQGSGKI